MKIAIHTATIKLSSHEQIMVGSMEKQEILKEAREMRRRFPGKKVYFLTTLEEVEGGSN